MSRSRIVRGRKTQALVAAWFAERGWPHATSRGSSEAGEDILHMGGVSIEVKASSRFDVLAAIRQSEANCDGKYPVVVHRPDGYGPERIDRWVASMSLAALTCLLIRAGLAEVPEDFALKTLDDLQRRFEETP